MAIEEIEIDELILQVFEEHEDIFFWPVKTQKDAKTFVKFIHEKGVTYEDICKEIDEFEHNFSAWRKGLGRVGIGARMIERINKTVESVIESDDEDNMQYNLKQLAKINKKNDELDKAKAKKETTQVASQAKDAKQQQSDLTSSMMKNIDKHVASEKTQEPVKPKEAVKPKEDLPKKEPVKQSEPIRASKPEPVIHDSPAHKLNNNDKPEVITNGSPESKPLSAKQEPVQKKVEPVASTRETVKKTEEVKDEPKTEETHTHKEEEKSEPKDKAQDPEVDEVKRKMEAIRKKVEEMKKQKAEKMGASHPPPADQVDGTSSAQTPVTSPSPAEGGGEDKYEAMRKKIENLRHKIKSDDEQSSEQNDAQEEEVPPKPAKRSSKVEETIQEQEAKVELTEPKSPSINREPDKVEIKTETLEMTAKEDQDVESESDEESESVSESYDSDLDPDTYDSDIEYEVHKDVQKLKKQIEIEKARQEKRDGPGHVYIFSDSPPGERSHRVKIGVTRCPEKKFAQAHSFNPSFKQVACTAVSKRKAALKDLNKALDSYKLEQHRDWFSGPIDQILQAVSMVTEKYGSGPGLSSFQTDSFC